jgi:hypothetical protein
VLFVLDAPELNIDADVEAVIATLPGSHPALARDRPLTRENRVTGDWNSLWRYCSKSSGPNNILCRRMN